MTLIHNHNEQELLQQLAVGSEEAFTVIYNSYWKQLYFLAHKHLKSAQAAEEIVQDVFLAIWRKKETNKILSLPVYLVAMTRYKVYRQIATNKKIPQTELNAESQQLISSEQEALLENKLLLEMVEKLSTRLPEKCRLVFVYNKLLDQTLQQVAKNLNISPKTAEAHLTKALKVVRGKFGDALSAILFL